MISGGLLDTCKQCVEGLVLMNLLEWLQQFIDNLTKFAEEREVLSYCLLFLYVCVCLRYEFNQLKLHGNFL